MRKFLLALGVSIFAANCFAVTSESRYIIEIVLYTPAKDGELPTGRTSTTKYLLRKGETVECETQGSDVQYTPSGNCVVVFRKPSITGPLRVTLVKPDEVLVGYGGESAIMLENRTSAPKVSGLEVGGKVNQVE